MNEALESKGALLRMWNYVRAGRLIAVLSVHLIQSLFGRSRSDFNSILYEHYVAQGRLDPLIGSGSPPFDGQGFEHVTHFRKKLDIVRIDVAEIASETDVERLKRWNIQNYPNR